MKPVVVASKLTVLGAIIVCLLSKQQEVLAGLLVGLICLDIIRKWLRQRSASAVVAQTFVIVTTATIGYLTESWGTSHGHWTYHDLPAGMLVPYWVPLAWAIAGELLYWLEERVLPLLSLKMRLAAILFLGMALPLLGESICIGRGVWTYHWPVQLFGVPLLALALISYAHATFLLIRRGFAAEALAWQTKSTELLSRRK